ncbi:undecaprenyl-phosphate glucose phosphotransferase [Methanobacterium alkalithermotolerans]|uniref:Undecaprenyl-phosphate glucose phosphotransferase n=1 Tax=Methanobacterium alkalithermotolerans TaxID=2731220 RepID=A0A8T8K593_9EURY|nr:undecaprenyl-phosphate glucose phosphotransferase [Methanobacterium alkalithermotolerans]QUH23758.1 undecaprenyl-phosphate glucose phosphotransferase [Methanobacterium alkalithermotolerans]
MIKENQRFFNVGLVLIDLLIISFSLFLAWEVRFTTGLFGLGESVWNFQQYMLLLLVVLPLYIFLYNLFGLYQPHRTKSLSFEALNIFKVNFLGLLTIISLLFILEYTDYSRLLLALFGIFSTFFSITERLLFRKLLRSVRARGFNIKYMLIVGAGELGKKVARKIHENEYLGYHIIGFVDDNFEKGTEIDGLPVMGNMYDLKKIILNNPLDRIIIAISPRHYTLLDRIIDICEKNGVKADIVPDYYRYFPAKPLLKQIDDIPVINIRYVPLDDYFNRGLKRMVDVLMAIGALILLSPLFIIVAFLVKVSSPGPVIFKQERMGLNRKTFHMYKFRSMHVQADENKDDEWTVPHDPRRTRVGSFIRRCSIDELPQIINVLKGEMSFIGPRPERPVFVEQFRDEIPKYMIKHHVRPGMSGWAQVHGWRGDTCIKRRIEYDIFYVENWTIRLDIKIFFMTLFRGFRDKNAY